MIEALIFLLLDDVFNIWDFIEIIRGNIDLFVVDLEDEVFLSLRDILFQLVHPNIIQFISLLNMDRFFGGVTIPIQDHKVSIIDLMIVLHDQWISFVFVLGDCCVHPDFHILVQKIGKDLCWCVELRLWTITPDVDDHLVFFFIMSNLAFLICFDNDLVGRW